MLPPDHERGQYHSRVLMLQDDGASENRHRALAE